MTVQSAYQPAWIKPYDPADSPGPIPSVIERFRPRQDGSDEPEPDKAEIEAARYAVVLLPPEAADAMGHDRCEAGLQLYRDNEWDGSPPHLDEAARQIGEACGEPVILVEHHSDLTYWTARLRR